MSTSAEKQNIFNSMSFQMNSIKVFPFDHSVVNITHEFHILLEIEIHQTLLLKQSIELEMNRETWNGQC